MRYAAGRPAPGLRPQVFVPVSAQHQLSQQEPGRNAGEIIVLINKTDSQTFAQQFRHMVLKTQDPNERYDSALNFFKAAYYQRGHEFDDQLTALFGPHSDTAELLHGLGRCRLHFDQFNQRFELDCIVRELPEHDHSYQLTYWHNRLFNPTMPAGVRILAFEPDWMTAVAETGQ